VVNRVYLGLVAFGLMSQSALAQQPCERLTDLRVGTATITSAVAKPEGPFTPPAGAAPAAGAQQAPPPMLPAHCAVAGVLRPTSDSEIKFAMWLPTPAAWNGKYRQEGNGGWAGVIPYNAMIDPLRRGYVTAATDDGHEGGPLAGADWAIGHPEKLVDFGHRAVHEVAVHAKQILAAHYGRPATRAYFVGCSDGGREALMEAQRYAEDFDGIIAAAPANRWSHLFTSFVWNERALLATPEHRIPASKLPAIQSAVLAACDALDGVKDGLLENPRACKFDPGAVACRTGDTASCLTASQLEALNKIYGGPKLSTGEQIYPGLPPGGEAIPGTWANWLTTEDPTKSIQSVLGNAYYSGAVFEDKNWDVRKMDFDRDFQYGERKAAPILNSSSPDLRSFRARGGKIIQYHGWADAAITPLASIEYYEQVRRFMTTYPDARGDSKRPIEDFYRLFMVPGLGHCAGGVGPVRFGNGGAVSPQAMNDPNRDVFAALERWVEQGVAPEQWIGQGPIPGDAAKTMTRPICQYPKVARYDGSGDVNDASNFACAAQ
jgi:feruloyl esterase